MVKSYLKMDAIQLHHNYCLSQRKAVCEDEIIVSALAAIGTFAAVTACYIGVLVLPYAIAWMSISAILTAGLSASFLLDMVPSQPQNP